MTIPTRTTRTAPVASSTLATATTAPGARDTAADARGIRVSALALGSWNTWDRSPYDTVVATIRRALDAGVTFFDVGIYGDHLEHPDANSTDMIFARTLAEIGVARDAVQLAAKGWLPAHGPANGAALETQLDAWLRNQHTDHADVFVLGDLMEPTGDYTPIVAQLVSILTAGKARAWAVNNWAAREVAELTRQANAAGIPGPDYAQHKYGLTRRSVPEGAPFRGLGEEFGVTVQASSVFDGGLIFGPRAAGTARMIAGDIGGTQARIRNAVPRIREAAAALGASPAQLAIAVPLTNPQVSSVLVGARTPDQLADNLGAFNLIARHGADEIRRVADEFWFDRDVVSPDAGWGTVYGDDPATYVVEER